MSSITILKTIGDVMKWIEHLMQNTPAWKRPYVWLRHQWKMKRSMPYRVFVTCHNVFDSGTSPFQSEMGQALLKGSKPPSLFEWATREQRPFTLTATWIEDDSEPTDETP